MKLYVLHDKKSGLYGPTMMAMNDGHMSRTLHEAYMGSQEQQAKYPEDYDLYEVAEYDNQTGRVRVDGDPRFVVNLSVILQAR